MIIVRAFGDGLRRVSAAPAVLFGVYLLTLLLALPLAGVLRAMIGDHLGESLTADRVAEGIDYDWWQEFESQAAGLGTTFSPTIIGFAAPLQNLSDLLDHEGLPAVVGGVVAAYLVLWAFLVGGVLDRYARNRPTRPSGFFQACGVFFFRFFRLGVMAFVVYAALFELVHGWLFDGVYERVTRDVTVERSAFLVRLGLYVLFGLLLVVVNLVFDYAKIRAVVEDRRSMIGALRAGARFVARQPLRTAGLYLAVGLLFGVVLAAYAAVAPGAWGPGWSLVRGLLIGQIYVLARLWVKLVFYASQTSLFQASLAHAGYTAAPTPVWPESPGAEAIGNAGPWRPS